MSAVDPARNSQRLLPNRLPHWIIALVVLTLFASIAEWRRMHPGGSTWLKMDQTDQIGAEYDTIAQAVRNGRGFADVFHRPTGPTAWMPPLLVYFTAGLYWIFQDDRGCVVTALWICKMAVLSYAAILFVNYCRNRGGGAAGCIILAVGLASDFFELFQRTHDTWLIMLIVTITWHGLQRWPPQFRLVRIVGWGVFGGLAALSGPIVGLAWAVTTSMFWIRQQAQHSGHAVSVKALAAIATAAITSILVVTPWLVRNRVVMGRWIPIKSNGVYELWQSQVFDDDGVLDSIYAWKHPWGYNGFQRDEYARRGEIEFISSRWPATWDSIVDRPSDFARRVSNRLFAAVWYYTPLNELDESLKWPIRFTRVYFCLPVLGLIIVLWRRQPLSDAAFIAICLYLTVLVPYILVSYYGRYAAPLTFMKMMLVYHGFEALFCFFKRDSQCC